ncbi:hypothetical protein SAMN05660776_1360 [Salegentibacter holothuriorum]|uniref:Uncharacterized protein n=1 Tax=Salegentibacter holothuriorum TaxID=241145 RepID=A0A1T5BNP1_9FLAO|nr:hypothetical protein [Salegentibacter holothuriorum]SKB48911.1 hypothetical protein SAMN05660776_1360 [Salegentibacter holothuriorum]
MTSNQTQDKVKASSKEKSLSDIIGFIAVLTSIFYLVKILLSKTDTNIISNDAREVLDSQDGARQLRHAVDKYHITGDWGKTNINKIL